MTSPRSNKLYYIFANRLCFRLAELAFASGLRPEFAGAVLSVVRLGSNGDSVAYPSLVVLYARRSDRPRLPSHQPSEFHRMVEIGRGPCTLANVPAERAVEFSDISRRSLKGF